MIECQFKHFSINLMYTMQVKDIYYIARHMYRNQCNSVKFIIIFNSQNFSLKSKNLFINIIYEENLPLVFLLFWIKK